MSGTLVELITCMNEPAGAVHPWCRVLLVLPLQILLHGLQLKAVAILEGVKVSRSPLTFAYDLLLESVHHLATVHRAKATKGGGKVTLVHTLCMCV